MKNNKILYFFIIVSLFNIAASFVHPVTPTLIVERQLDSSVFGTALAAMDDVLNGTTAVATSKEDYVAAARILSKFAEKNDNFKIKAGFLDGELISLEKVDSLAKLPSKEQLLATVCMAFQAPMASFARVIQAIVDKDGEAAPAEAPAEEAAPAAEEAAE